MKILFTYLTAFSSTGGIEKFNKAFIKVLSEIRVERDWQISCLSLHDVGMDEKYSQGIPIKCFKGNRFRYLPALINEIRNTDIFITGHINLALAAWIASVINPQIRIVLITHGLELTLKLNSIKKYLLKRTNRIWAVSEFTRNILINLQSVPFQKISILPNTIDPFFKFPGNFRKPDYLMHRYQISPSDKIILTICRLSSEEAYKGYDRVIECLPGLLTHFSGLKYLIAGKYDTNEKLRLEQIIGRYNLNEYVKIVGYVDEKELGDHFLLGDVFIMPSLSEGFGIVFLEALACGLPVIAGNKDGSVDALDQGKMGWLVDPNSTQEISKTLIDVMRQSGTFDETKKMKVQQDMISVFGYAKFKARLNDLLCDSIELKSSGTGIKTKSVIN